MQATVMRQTAARTALFATIASLLLFIFFNPLSTLIQLSSSDEHFSHTFVVPIIAGFLLFRDREAIFRAPRYSPASGAIALILGVLFGLLSFSARVQSFRLSLEILGLITGLIGTFILCYGAPAFTRARFACLFLLLMVPIPLAVMAGIVYSLQVGSAAVAELFFRFFGTPAFRDGLSFVLPGFTIQVAVECSGIRSTLALVVTTLLASYLFLRSGWARMALCLAIFPLSILKNGFRIAVLSWLGLYVSPAFLHGSLHHKGGVLFFMLALVLLIPIIRLLQKAEDSLADPSLRAAKAATEAS